MQNNSDNEFRLIMLESDNNDSTPEDIHIEGDYVE